MKKQVISAVVATLIATPVFASEKVKVTDVTKTVTRQIPHTEQICNIVEVPIYGQQTMDTEGAIVGGIIGGVIGNQIGKGGGRDAATGIGAIAGAVIGGKKDGGVVGYRQEQRCHNQTTYTQQSEVIYSHSVASFYHEGKFYQVKFQK